MASSGKQWYVGEDGSIPLGELANSVTYHSALNSIIVTTNESAVKIYDVTSGSVLQKSNLSAGKGEKIQCMYLQEKNKMVFSSSQSIGVRSDLQGVLLLDTALQTPVAKSDDLISLELPLAEAIQFLKSLTDLELSCSDYLEVVVKELEKEIDKAQIATKGNHKTTKWATVCVSVPHVALKTVSSSLESEMRRVNSHNPGLSIASSVNDRLSYLLPSHNPGPTGSTVDRSLMYSEAARRETFKKWPHMNYKWALPDPMAQAGFYHQPNVSGDDRAMCFTCNVCLVCWEPTDEPWSEHERHSPSCPFVKGEHTQNVPLSVTFATQPAQQHEGGQTIQCVSTTASEDFVGTSTKHGSVVIWNMRRTLKPYCQFMIDPNDTVIALKTGVQVERDLSSKPTSAGSDSHLEDSSDHLTSHGAEGESCSGQEDNVDAKAVPKDVQFSVGSLGADSKDDHNGLHEIPLHKSTSDAKSFMRPNEDIVVHSMCIVEKLDQCSDHLSVKTEVGKADTEDRIKRSLVQPSLVCGVLLRKTCNSVNENRNERAKSDVQTEVQLMNKVNEVVSGETSPVIIPNSEDEKLPKSDSAVDILSATNFVPYILVVAVKEDVKRVSKQPSTDSLKPSTSTGNLGNIVQPLGNIAMNQQDWSLIDHMYDSDQDVQMMKMIPGPASLSTSSPTEGSKQEEIGETSHKCKTNSSLESAIKLPSKIQAGCVLQCIALPSELQSDQLCIKSICPTLDRQHLVVAVSPKSVCSAKSVTSGLSHSSNVASGSGSLFSSSTGSFQISADESDMTSASSTENNGNTNASLKAQLDNVDTSHGCILVYRFNYNCDNHYACIEDKPVAIRPLQKPEGGVERLVILPSEISEQIEEEDIIHCDDELFVPAPSLTSVSSGRSVAGPYGQIAVIYSCGKMSIMNLADLSVLVSITPPGPEKFCDVTYCSGIDRLSVCSDQGKLYFYRLSEEMPELSDMAVEAEEGPNRGLVEYSSQGDLRLEEALDQSPKASSSELLAKHSLSFELLTQLHNLIQFENLMPRFTATVPPCWSEIQQEQQQRRHPQHLQHQGEATQHTRTWKLQPDTNTWDEHLFEIVLPRVCCVGHVDVKFTFNPLCTSNPNIQVTLLKQNISGIGRVVNTGPELTSTPVDSQINFSMKSPAKSTEEPESSGSTLSSSPPLYNNVQDPQFLESHNAEILCGPVNIADCVDLSGNTGIVSLTSPQLLMSKPRSFLLHIKGFPSKKREQTQEKSKQELRKKRTAAQSSDKSRNKTIKALFDNYSTTGAGKTKVENWKGCDWLTELSVTIRKTKKTSLPKERMQRNAMVELTSFHEKLLSTVSFEEGFLLTGVSPDHVQNMCLDILIWITSIQMNDPDRRLASKCILSCIQQQCKRLLMACCIQGTRTTAHKCARLLSLCMEYSKSSADPDLAPLFSKHILDALVECLPLLPSAYSAGGLKWYFTLLNRVKCMDVCSVAAKCAELLNSVAKQFHDRASSLHALLKARYGLNGHPFEPDLFDMELPQAVKQIHPSGPPTSSFTCAVGGTSSSSTASGSGQQHQQQHEDLDFYDLFNTPAEKSSKTLLECARNHILGMLEVEPLHFTCHSTSDGTKMERLDSTGNTTNATTLINSTGLSSTGLGSSNVSGTINFGELMPQSGYQQALLPPAISYTLPHSVAVAKQIQELSAKNDPYVKQKIMHIKQILYEVGKNTPTSTQKTPSGSSELMPSTPKTTPQVMTPPLTPPNEAWQQMLSHGEKNEATKGPGQQRPTLPVQASHSLLQPPPPQVLVIERIYSGARRFVILDFGKPILLTDVIIPLCGDLASLSIDVWIQGEEVDGQRLVVATDIGVRSLVMNNIMPPPVCRFLKITTIGRYGSGTTRSKIPIGAFYGHSYILPWEWSPKPEHHTSPSTSSVACQLDLPTQSQLLTQLGSFMSLLEDIQCRYSLSRARLESLLVQVESMQYASYHTQYFLKKSKNNEEDNNISQTYNDCLQLQLQQNLAMRAIDRLQSAIGLRVPSVVATRSQGNQVPLLKQASTDKLRFLLENLLETVISLTNPSPSIPQTPMSLFACMDHHRCQDLFKYLCFNSTPRVQILTGMMLVRVCGSQPWFGDFLGNMLQENFHSETMQVFSQDRVFLLLTAMGQRSLQGPCSISIMESLLSMLARVLYPVLGGLGDNRPGSHAGQLDLTLVGWVLLFLCRNLDQTIITNGNGEEEGASAKREQGTNLSNRWNFMQANGNVKYQINKSKSVKLYRRSLQKRLLHHKQKLMDLEHVKKSFLNQDPSNFNLLKHQEKQFRKELSQYASKHLKDIIQIRKNDTEMLRKMPHDNKDGDDKDRLDYDGDTLLVLPKEKCLPVVHGLMALLLGMDFTCNVDLFLVTCKVLARVCIATRPAIALSEAMSQEQLEKLILLAANLEFNHGNISWGGPWAGHALTCLLQDILEGERTYPSPQLVDGMTDDEMSSQVEESESPLNSSSTLNVLDLTQGATGGSPSSSDGATAQPKDNGNKVSLDKESSLMMDMLMDEGYYEEVAPEKLHAFVTGENFQPPPSSSSNVMYVQPINGPFDLTYSSLTPEIDDDKFKAGGGKDNLAMKTLKAVFGSTGYQKPSTSTAGDIKAIPAATASLSASSQGLSTAQDARLELGLETQAELKLKIMLSLQADTLHTAFTSPLPVCLAEYPGQTQSRSSPTDDELSDSVSNSQTSSCEMLSQAFDDLFSQLLLQRVNMDALIQLWLTLNEETPLDSTEGASSFDPSRSPVIPLSVVSVKNLLACVAGSPSLPVRTWVLVFHSLTLLANLKISGEGQGIDRSMVVAMMADSNMIQIITKFLSGSATTAPSTSFESNSQVGPSAVKAFHLFLQRLRICICGEDDIQNLKEIMLKLVYTLTAERGAFYSSLGPLDAQCKFLEFILELTYDLVDINNAISVIESVSALVHRHILCQERVVCKSTSDNYINARSCFGGLFASLLRGGDASTRNGDVSRDSLMCSLLKMVNALLLVLFPTRHGRQTSSNTTSLSNSSDPQTDSSKLSQARASSSPHVTTSLSRSDEEKSEQSQSGEPAMYQTDEQKTENAHQERANARSEQTINLADIILGRQNIMCNLIQALSYCNSNTMAMILGSSMPNNIQDSFTGDPLSVGDGIYQILVTLSKECNDNKLLMDSLFLYLSGNFSVLGSPSLCRLSEPLLWYILKVLDTSRMLKLFLEKGGVDVICRNFVNCNSRIISTSPSLISTIMQNMNGKGNMDKRKKWETESADGLQNFAPLGTIVSSSPTASPAEVLIVSAPQHRRARSAPWSYHFYPDEAWVDLKITLPFAILLKEVQIQPHSQTLSTCPSFVSLEASQDGVTSFPLSAPMCTSSLVYIKLQLQRPEVVTSVTVRLHRARDSMTIGLSQILLMGYSAFGEIGYKTNNFFLPTEDFVSRSSVGWIRLLHHCLVSQKDMEGLVAEAAAPTAGLLNTCSALLLSPISSVYSPTIEAVLLKLGLHSGDMGLALIDNLLRSNGPISESGFSQYLGKVNGVASESTVEILYQLGTVQDRWTSDRLQAMLQWLGDSARVAMQRNSALSEDAYRRTPHQISSVSIPGPAPSHVHCIAAVLWQSNEITIEYNLSHLITKHLVSSLYEWSCILNRSSHLKKAVDYVLCSLCHICPEFFTRIMEWMGVMIAPEFGLSASISDDRKDSSHYQNSMTDDSKEASHALGQNIEAEVDPPQSSSTAAGGQNVFKHLNLDETHYSTLALTCKSPLASKQLLESGFPAVLAQGLFEFCNRVISTFADSWSKPEGISDSCKSMNGTTGDNNIHQNHTGLCITADMVAPVLNFFSELSSMPQLKDWLGGADGNIFWPVLLAMLCNTPLHTQVNGAMNKTELISAEDRASIETATVNFFTSVISCHILNQMLFSKVLYDVIKEQGTASKAGMGVCPLSGFTRRLFLQVLLEDEKILVAFRAAQQQYRIHIPNSASQLQHPQFGAGRRFRTMQINMHSTVGELMHKVLDTPSLAAQILECHSSGSDKKSDESKKETSQIGLELVENIYAANTVEAGTLDSPGSSSKSLPPRPPTRRGRTPADTVPKQISAPQLSLYHKYISNKSMPNDMSLSQLLQVLQQHGLPQGQGVLDFVLQIHNNPKDALTDDPDEVPDDVLLTSDPFPTALQIFASVGGLALLAEHLPLLYPEISRQITTSDMANETGNGTQNDSSQDWVTVDNYPEELYEMYEPVMSPAPQSSRGHSLGSPTIPPHSLVAFGLFLRLPGYAEVLLKERKKAQCLLRLVLGVTDDGDGGHILTSPLAGSLPTLPFIVLKSLFDATPLTTDDGVLLRRMCLDIGALHLILACLSVLSHHAPRVNTPGFQQEAHSILSAMQAPTSTTTTIPTTSEEKAQQYWAKGTGFGTGSTTSSWDAEQALVRQRSEEEHVTCLLQVLASYINPGGNVPDDFESDEYESQTDKMLPEVVPEMLSQSCLIPALSSYLRNDSVLDMARHVPLYRALLQLLRGLSVCPSLVMLLLPLDKDGNGDTATAIEELLDKMRGCVDTYASRLKSNKGKIGGSKEEDEENEGLAMLIPDIQSTAKIVQSATNRMKTHDQESGQSGSNQGSEASGDRTQEGFDQVYLSTMEKLQFGQYEMVVEEGSTLTFTIRHHYENNVKAAGDIKNPNRIRRLAQEAVTLSTSLPLSVSSSVFVRCDEERLDIMKVLITGPEDTPYANGCFEFDVYFPQDYPNAPPYINLETTGNHTVRFNPNLYNDGKVCLSVLNTWHGRPEEKWSAQTSSFLQVLVSIQSLILVCEPYFNEPGYERSRGTPSGTASSREYDANIRQATVKWAILEQMKNASPCFKQVIQKHFWLKRHRILKQCEEWIAEMEAYSSDKRTGRTIAHCTLALKKHYNQLREEFAKIKAPEGLENFEKGDIDPKEKQYETEQNSPSTSKDSHQIVPADSNANSMVPSQEDWEGLSLFANIS